MRFEPLLLLGLLLTPSSLLQVRASQTFLFCDPILEKKFLRDPWMGSLHVNDI